MNANTQPPQPNSTEPPEALIEKARGLSLVWLIPLVAALIGGWLAYKTLTEKGPLITITFKEANGLESGKTRIKYKDIEVGLVETVRLNDDLTGVIVKARMEQSIAAHLREGSRFWVVKPHLGLSGISGLDTLMAGNYIAVEFGKGEQVDQFRGHEHAPKVDAESPGKIFNLVAPDASNLQEGAPIYFRNIEAGRVVDVRLADDKESVQTEIFINAPFDQLVRDNSRFWVLSAIDASLSAEGFDVKVGSLLTMLSGGIAFDTPNLNTPGGQPSKPDTKFELYRDFDAIAAGNHRHKHFYLLKFADSVRGLSIGAPVEIRGIKIGTVTDVKLNFNLENMSFNIPVIIEIDGDSIANEAAVQKYLDATRAERAEGHTVAMEKLVQKGMRARLKTGSMLTGQLFVDLDLYNDTPPRKVVYGGTYPEIPTLPSVADQLQNDVMTIMAKLKAIPIDSISNELLATVKGANRLVNSPELQDVTKTLDLALKDIRALTQNADKQIASIANGLEASLTTTRQVLQQAEPGSPMAVNMNKALEELAGAARSIKTLSDYLERHPEALIKGKAGKGQ